MMKVVLENNRILSIDIFRGITILIMIWVNEMHGVANISTLLKHMPADADAMTFVDVVFPAFLFIVGMSIPFAISNRLKKGDSQLDLFKHIGIRTIGLLVLGLFMVNGEMGFDESAMIIPIALWSLLSFVFAILIWNIYPKSINENIVKTLKITGILGLIVLFFLYKGEEGVMMQPHWWGILGLIGWAYFIATIVYVLSKGKLFFIFLAIVFLTAVFVLIKTFEPSLNYLMLIENASHATITLSGVVVSLLLFDKNIKTSLNKKVLSITGYAIIVLIAGFILRPYFSISKIWATPSWSFYSVFICIAIFLFLYYIVDVSKKSNWAMWLKPAATNPLLIYILPTILLNIQGLLSFSIVPNIATSGLAGVLWSFAFALIMVWLVKWFNKINIRLHL